MLDVRSFRISLATLAVALVAAPLAAFEAELEEVSRAIATALSESGKDRVAVVDFTGIQGEPTPLGSFLAEELSVVLVGASPGFEVVDRLHLQSILGANELRRAAVFEVDTTRKLSELTGIDALVTGRVTPTRSRVRISIKVLDTETGSLVAAASATLERDDLLDELLDTPASGIQAAPAIEPSRVRPAPVPEVPVPSPIPVSSAPSVVAATRDDVELAPPVAVPTKPVPADLVDVELPESPAPEPSAPTTRQEPPSPETPATDPAPSVDPVPIPAPASAPARPVRAPVREPATITVEAVRILESSVQVTIGVENNTDTVLEWGESGTSRLLDADDSLLVCSECPEGVEGDAVLIASGSRQVIDLFFTHDSKAAALEKRDAFAFFFNAKAKEIADFEGPFTLTLEHEFRASGDREPRLARVVFADLESR